MSQLLNTDDPPLDDVIRDTRAAPTPEHDAWFRGEVEKALADKRGGKSLYRALRDVAAKFGFNAR